MEESGGVDEEGDDICEASDPSGKVCYGVVKFGRAGGDLGHGGEDGSSVCEDSGEEEGDGEDGEMHFDAV